VLYSEEGTFNFWNRPLFNTKEETPNEYIDGLPKEDEEDEDIMSAVKRLRGK
jgi:hypothetical protein